MEYAGQVVGDTWKKLKMKFARRLISIHFSSEYIRKIYVYPPGYSSSWKLDRPVWISDQMLLKRGRPSDRYRSFELDYAGNGLFVPSNRTRNSRRLLSQTCLPLFFFERIERLVISSFSFIFEIITGKREFLFHLNVYLLERNCRRETCPSCVVSMNSSFFSIFIFLLLYSFYISSAWIMFPLDPRIQRDMTNIKITSNKRDKNRTVDVYFRLFSNGNKRSWIYTHVSSKRFVFRQFIYCFRIYYKKLIDLFFIKLLNFIYNSLKQLI